MMVKNILKMSLVDKFQLLFSHHTKEDYNRTLHVPFFGRNLYMCTRCFGILVGFLIFNSQSFLLSTSNSSLFILPYFALLDWLLNQTGLWNGNNYTRFFSGLLLGAGIVWYYHVFLINSLSLIIIINFLVFVITILFKDFLFTMPINLIKKFKMP